MFNALLSISDLFILTLLFFTIFLVFKLLFIKNKKLIFAYHIILFSVLFILAIGGGSVQNDGYHRLDKFVELENNGELALAKNNPQDYDSMLQIDLKEFNNSNEFKNYLKKRDVDIDRAEAIFIAWLFVFLTEISMLIVQSINYIIFVIKALLKRKKV